MRDSDPTAALSAPRRGRKLPHVLTRDEVKRLLSQPKGTDPPPLRDRALLELMYACGLRASEAIGLEVADVDLRSGCCARAARARRSGSCRSAARPSTAREALPARAAGPSWSAAARSRTCSSTSAAAQLTRQGLYKIVRRHAPARRARRTA